MASSALSGLDDVDSEYGHSRSDSESSLEGEERHLEKHRGSKIIKKAATVIEALDPTQPHTFHQPQASSNVRAEIREDGIDDDGRVRPVRVPLSKKRKEDPSTSPSVTLSIFDPSANRDWGKTLALVASSLTINLFLPFVNGVMLGFGEIVAHEILAVWGWTGARSVIGRLKTSIRRDSEGRRSLLGAKSATAGLTSAAEGLKVDGRAQREEAEGFWQRQLEREV